MSTLDDTGYSPGMAASPEALDVLHVLHRHPEGLRRPVLMRLTGISHADLDVCLDGLVRRGRAVCTGRGVGATWRTYWHAVAAGLATRQQPTQEDA